MFSSTAEYALRAIVYLACHREGATSSQAIAATTKAPAGYISKILKDLVGAGIVTSRRGPSGGFTLARRPERITVLEVINAVDRLERIRECPLGLPEHGTKLCRLHQKLDDAIALVEKSLHETSIAEMVEPSRASGKCVFPTINADAARGAGSRAAKRA